MRLLLWTAAILMLASCERATIGQVCKTDDDCGQGFDCYYERCARVCSKDEQCAPGSSCLRYRCLTSGGRVPNAAATADGASIIVPAPVATQESATPLDPVTAELRAIRRELELLRQGQTRVIELLERERAADGPQNSVLDAPKRSAPQGGVRSTRGAN